eukprot:GILI01013507.1.p1 GENE.GILI01013507.1~~GILI01013507.1.p1  ORF type:complete len:390 (+),score=100.74 GILI01013507.1:41-1171(+)
MRETTAGKIERLTEHAAVIHGSQIQHFDDDDCKVITQCREIVFARTSPQQKLLIVEHFQANKEVVAMTGDGVNDSPALRRADIGVAMGLMGSDVAREAADVILMDDNFASIVVGVQEGRIVFDNLTKTIGYTLVHLWPEILPVLINLSLGLPLALSSIMVIFIDTLTEMGPAISLSWEPMEADIMKRPPRDPQKDRLVSAQLLAYCYLQAGVVEAFICFFSFFWFMSDHGFTFSSLLFTDNFWTYKADPLTAPNGAVYSGGQQEALLAEAQSVYLVTVVMSQLFHIHTVKTRQLSVFTHGLLNNKKIFLGWLSETVLLVFIVYVPFMNIFIGSRPVQGKYWLVSLMALVFFWLYNEGRRYIARRNPNGWFKKLFIW